MLIIFWFVNCWTLRAPLINTLLSTVRSPDKDKSDVFILAVGPIKRFPPKDKSFATNKRLLKVASSSTNALFWATKSSVMTLEPTPPIIAVCGMLSDG